MMQPIATLQNNAKRWNWFTPNILLGISILGYLLDNLKNPAGSIFNLIGLIGLIAGLILLIRDTGKRKAKVAQGWILLVIAVLVGIFF